MHHIYQQLRAVESNIAEVLHRQHEQASGLYVVLEWDNVLLVKPQVSPSRLRRASFYVPEIVGWYSVFRDKDLSKMQATLKIEMTVLYLGFKQNSEGII